MASVKGKGNMNNAKGLCSYKSNPMGAASRTSPMCGPALGVPGNSDQSLANKLMQQAHKERESLRGMNGM